jgi:FlaA1/EpsC-like NDP-sugar epimerase
MPPMRRRIRSAAALGFHRHSLPQVAVDAGLVALAYYLAYLLRFDGDVRGVYQDLFERTIAFVIVGSVFVFALFGLYRHWMRYATQRDYLQIAEACIVATLSLVAYVAIVQPRLEFNGTRFTSVDVPASVIVLYGLLMLVFIGGSRFFVHMLYERPLSGFRARRDARSVLIVGAGCCCARSCATRTSATGPSASSTTTRASSARGSTGACRCSGRPTTSRGCSRTSSPTRC